MSLFLDLPNGDYNFSDEHQKCDYVEYQNKVRRSSASRPVFDQYSFYFARRKYSSFYLSNTSELKELNNKLTGKCYLQLGVGAKREA